MGTGERVMEGKTGSDLEAPVAARRDVSTRFVKLELTGLLGVTVVARGFRP